MAQGWLNLIPRVRRNSRNRGTRDFHDFGSLPRFLTNAAISQRGREFVRLLSLLSIVYRDFSHFTAIFF